MGVNAIPLRPRAGQAPSPLTGEGWGEGFFAPRPHASMIDTIPPHPRPLSRPNSAFAEFGSRRSKSAKADFEERGEPFSFSVGGHP